MRSFSESQRRLIQSITQKQRAFAICKRGVIISQRFFDTSTVGKAMLLPVMNKLSLGHDDVILNDGLISLDDEYMATWGFTPEEIKKGLPELAERGYMKYVGGTVYQLVNSWSG